MSALLNSWDRPVVDEQRSLAVTQVVVPGIALVVAGPILAVRFGNNGPYVALGTFAAAVGVGLLVLSYIRYRRRL